MDEGMTAIAEEQATPAIETQAPETEPTDEPIDLEAAAEAEAEAGSEEEGEADESQEGAEPALEMVEVEINGKKHKIPAELKDNFLMHADYTRKRQADAEQARAVEARAAEVEAQYNVSQEVLEARAALMVHDNQLKQFENLNWQQLENEDPVGAMSAWRQFQQLKETRGNIAGYLNEQQTTRSAQAEQATANRLRETRAFAEKEIPGWSPDVDTKITEFAEKQLGYSRETLLGAYTPAVYRTLHLAWLGHQSLTKQQAAPKPAPAQIKPLTTVSSKASPSARRSEADMPMGEFAAWINKR
jgi:hypothetical protein